MSSKLNDNYVCDNLIYIEKLCDTRNLIIFKATKSLESNMEMMESVCQRVDDISANSNNLSELRGKFNAP